MVSKTGKDPVIMKSKFSGADKQETNEQNYYCFWEVLRKKLAEWYVLDMIIKDDI